MTLGFQQRIRAEFKIEERKQKEVEETGRSKGRIEEIRREKERKRSWGRNRQIQEREREREFGERKIEEFN